MAERTHTPTDEWAKQALAKLLARLRLKMRREYLLMARRMGDGR